MATALAAGVSSLILACLQIDGKAPSPLQRKLKVRDMFKEMKGKDTESKCVRPWVVFGEDNRADGDMFLPINKRKD